MDSSKLRTVAEWLKWLSVNLGFWPCDAICAGGASGTCGAGSAGVIGGDLMGGDIAVTIWLLRKLSVTIIAQNFKIVVRN